MDIETIFLLQRALEDNQKAIVWSPTGISQKAVLFITLRVFVCVLFLGCSVTGISLDSLAFLWS